MTNILAKFKRASDLFEKRQNGSKTSSLSCSNPKSLKCPPTQPILMLKITILGIALAAIVLSVAVPAMIADTIQADEITSSASISGEPILGLLPEVRISNLPAINETAVVIVTYTHDSTYVVTDTTPQAYPEAFSTGWRVSPGFEIVDSGNMTAEPFYSPGRDEPNYYQYLVPTHLNIGESVTYTFEVRAVEEGTNYVAGIGYYEVDAPIFMYLDDEETMFHSEHRALYPEMHQPPPKMSKNEMAQAEEAEHLRQLAEAIKNPPPNTGRPLEEGELIEAATMWVVKKGFTPEEAVERLAPLASLNVDDIRMILTGAGFSEDEINNVLPTDDA